jgi:hypothetical protein
MLRATMCPSSGENTVPMRHPVFVTLYRWLSINFLNMFIVFLYMFRATMYPSSGENTVTMRHPVFVTLYTQMTVRYAGRNEFRPDKYRVSHRYGVFSWWWAHSGPKHVEKSNKHIKKIYVPTWFYLQDYTRLRHQQNIKFVFILSENIYIYFFSQLLQIFVQECTVLINL